MHVEGIDDKNFKAYLLNRLSLFFNTFLIGIIGSFTAAIFIYLLDLVTNFALKKIVGLEISKISSIFSISHDFNSLLLIVVITLGGLISGFLVYKFAPEAEGHGTDAVIRAFHRTGGYIRPIVVPIKIITSAITIGTGGSAGREGPTALFSAGVGSIYSKYKKTPLRLRRLYVLIAMAAGLSAVFKSPIGTAFFSIEVLYEKSKFSVDELIFILFGSLIAFIITGYFFGYSPIFNITSYEITSIDTYLLIIVFGIICGIFSLFIPNVFYYTRDFFRKLKVSPYFKPAIGAFFVGVIGVFFPQVLGGGYDIMQLGLDGKIVWYFALILIFAKLLAFSLTIGSGGSGGVFAPTLFVGVMVGVLFGHIFNENVSLFAILGMAMIFGGAARVPLASILMVSEMTGDYKLLPALLLGTIFTNITYVLLIKYFKNIKYKSLYEAQLLDENYSPFFQIDKIREILLCFRKKINIKPEEISDEKLLDLLEKGIPLKIGDKALFFGVLTKDFTLRNEDGDKYISNLLVVYVFRDGKWIHPVETDRLYRGDEVLLYGNVKDLIVIKGYFFPRSEKFSVLHKQHKALEKTIQQKIPTKEV
ncbi:chloride channel protein [Caminibacter mediatlanticus TB-2]|uniref:Chloride channel protein n=1 Tax=Caminibacter mediatlanticus TB-2 TaxID=391592 RepID=A0ABX5VB98_9BACT|nr:chloride channel protein [Caminibacter mediatlanticus]QCT94101.1 chloride channel protein [Caminibacter mediatlanticus TB-2]